MMALFRMKVIWMTGLVSTFLILGGCVSTDSSDLDDYIAEILARPGSRIRKVDTRPGKKTGWFA